MRHPGLMQGTREAIQSAYHIKERLDCFVALLLAKEQAPYLPAPSYSETVCTTLPTGRVLATGTFISLTSASSYSGKVCSGALAFICTIL
jgi:hypothetical protein